MATEATAGEFNGSSSSSNNRNRNREGVCAVVRWRDVGTEGVANYLAPIIARNRPFLMSGYWAHQVLNKDAAQRWKSFRGIKSVLADNGLDQLRVDVSCTQKGSSFRGDKENRQQVRLKLIDMVEIAEAHELGKPHWATSEAIGLEYYLCQCPVVSREEGKPEVLSAIAGEFRTPSCVPQQDLLQTNLWLGAMETTTNMHYDANNNLLFVLKGSKRVALLPPNMSAGVQAMPVFSESANHSGLRADQTAAVVDSAEALRKGAVYAEVAEGEALFIPEGWWHQVTSSHGTVAINVWFKGTRPALCEVPSSRHMREYYLRCLVESLLADRLHEAKTESTAGRQGAAAADIEVTTAVAEGGGDTVGRPPGSSNASAEAAATRLSSPLCNPMSTADERNAYLRATGIERMTQELPRIARERPADWVRLVVGLDPVTAYVITTQWELAGGAASMPGFYAAIFGTGEEDAVGPAPAATREGAGVVGGSDVGVAGGVVGTSDGGVGGMSLSMGRAEGAETVAPAASLQQQQQQYLAGGAGVRSEEVKGVALQARLMRLREAFAKEQCAAVLRQATGW
eukprot:g8569.t1